MKQPLTIDKFGRLVISQRRVQPTLDTSVPLQNNNQPSHRETSTGPDVEEVVTVNEQFTDATTKHQIYLEDVVKLKMSIHPNIQISFVANGTEKQI